MKVSSDYNLFFAKGCLWLDSKALVFEGVLSQVQVFTPASYFFICNFIMLQNNVQY